MSMRTKNNGISPHILCEDWIGVAFGVQLFGNVYADVAALAVQMERGETALRLFDPYAPPRDIFAGDWPKGARIALYSNHYQRGLEPTEDDLRNLAALPEGTALYIVRGRRCVRWKGDNQGK